MPRGHRHRRLLVRAGLVAFLWMSVSPLSALSASAESGRAPHPETPVSTSPGDPESTTRRASRAPSVDRHAARPLTRAAVRQHIESISPVDWLSRFGPVEGGPRH